MFVYIVLYKIWIFILRFAKNYIYEKVIKLLVFLKMIFKRALENDKDNVNRCTNIYTPWSDIDLKNLL